MRETLAVTVRRAEPGDAMDIARVHTSSWTAYRGLIPDEKLSEVTLSRRQTQWREWLPEGGDGAPFGAERSVTFVAAAAGEIGGFCTIAVPARDDEEREGVGEVAALYVASERWGGGLGHALMKAAVEQMREAGCDEGMLWMLEGNERAERFYEREGWRRDGGTRMSQYYPGLPELSEARFRRTL
jgi:GNAT superfamily N-acetyltransferase